MAIQGTPVPMYTKHTMFLYFFDFFSFYFYFEKKNEQPNKNRQTTWKHERNMHIHEGMIEGCRCMKAWFQKQDSKADKKSSKESPTLDRKN